MECKAPSLSLGNLCPPAISVNESLHVQLLSITLLPLDSAGLNTPLID